MESWEAISIYDSHEPVIRAGQVLYVTSNLTNLTSQSQLYEKEMGKRRYEMCGKPLIIVKYKLTFLFNPY